MANSNANSSFNSRKRSISKSEGLDSNGFVKKAMGCLVKSVKLSTELPVAGSPSFVYYNDFPDYKTLLNGQSGKILTIMQKIINYQKVAGNVMDLGEGSSVDQKFVALTDINDRLLEDINRSLDFIENPKKAEESQVLVVASSNGDSGRFRRSHPLSWRSTSNTTATENANQTPARSSKANLLRLLSSATIGRPQMEFRTPPDNLNTVFVPLIRSKPNALQSLEASMKLDTSIEDQETISHPHPYQFELDQFSATADQLHLPPGSDAVPWRPLEDTPLVMVSTRAQLIEMINHLKEQTEIAVDLEHHNYRTFLGLTCLMQISSRSRDFIVDTLLLREDLHLLNTVFTDPVIVKVMHGSEGDLSWLQRDFGVYVVNLFDTFIASHVLSLARHSLSFLLTTYCDVTPNKEFQLADWRIRPLPEELVKYAREDTHYLLYIFDKLRQELQPRDLGSLVWERSRELCLRRYEKPIFTETDYLNVYRKSQKRFNTRQLFALERLYAWRDSIARLEDESTNYVLPNHMLMVLSEVLPREHTGIFAACHPVPPLVRKYVHDMHKIILEAREKPLQGTDQSWRCSVVHTLDTESLHPSLSRLDLSHTDEDEGRHNLREGEEHLDDKKKRSQIMVNVDQFMKASPKIPLLCGLRHAATRRSSAPLIHKICLLLKPLLSAQKAFLIPEVVEESEVVDTEGNTTLDQSVALDVSQETAYAKGSLLDFLTLTPAVSDKQPEDVDDPNGENVAVILRHENKRLRRKRRSDVSKRNTNMNGERETLMEGSNNDNAPEEPSSSRQFQPFNYDSESHKFFQEKGGHQKRGSFDPFTEYRAKKSRGGQRGGQRGRSSNRGGGGRGGGGRPIESGGHDSREEGEGRKERWSGSFRGGNRGGFRGGSRGEGRGGSRGDGRSQRGSRGNQKPRWK